MFIDLCTGDIGQIELLAGSNQNCREAVRLGFAQALKEDGHEKSGDLVVGYFPPQVAVDQEGEFFPLQLFTVALTLDQFGDTHDNL